MTTSLLESEEASPVTPTTAGALAVERIADISQLADLSDAWNRLASDVPFRRWEWLESWWRYFAEDRDELFVLLVRDRQQRLVGIAPWFRRKMPGLGYVVRFLGSGEVCSDYLTVLAAEEQATAVVEAIIDWLRGDGCNLWDAIKLEAVDESDHATSELAQRFAAAGHMVHRAPHMHCWRLPLTTDWEAYVATLSRSRRGTVRKLQRQYFDTGRAVVKAASTPQEFEQGWQVLVDLHQRRRQTLGEPGCFATQRFADFLKTAATRLFEAGQARLQWVEIESRPAAVELDLLGGDTVFMYQSGIDPELANERPGWLGTMASLRHAASAGFQFYDFIRGDEPYKAHWRAQPIALVDVRIVADRRRSVARDQLWCALQAAKGWGKTFRNRWRHREPVAAHTASET